MVDRAFEHDGTVARMPLVTIGPLQLREVGLLGSGPAQGKWFGSLVGRLFWQAWGQGAPGPVVGWLGGNVLCRYRLTIDYRNHVTYWRQITEPRTDELNAVGISLVHTPTGYRVGGLVRRTGTTSARGIEVGDQLTAVNGQQAASMSRGTILEALHGTPGDHKLLTLDRDGKTINVDAMVNDYSDEVPELRDSASHVISK